jgi:iron complex transport system ATP-binding protein
VPAVELKNVSKTLDGTEILRSIDWSIETDEHWVVVGPNGGGKSTLLRVAGLAEHPTSGSVRVLGVELGRADIRSLRSRVGISSAGLVDQLRGSLTAEEVVRCGRFGALEPWWHTYTESDTDRALGLLGSVGLTGFGGHTLATLSSGERQRALLARTLMNDPSLVLLDEPTAGLDFVGREQLIRSLDELAVRDDGPATVLVTHHLEDVPGSTTHLLAIGGGSIVAAGPIDEVLDEALLGDLFGVPVALTRHGRRWSARASS